MHISDCAAPERGRRLLRRSICKQIAAATDYCYDRHALLTPVTQASTRLASVALQRHSLCAVLLIPPG